MTDDQIKHMVDRFLGWQLPEHFRPDAGISFNPEYNVEYSAARGLTPPRHNPTGTNLFDCEQAESMVRYMIEGMPGGCIYCDRGERCVMHGKSGFLAGRLGHTQWCSHMLDERTCNCGWPRTTDGEHGENCPEQKGACPKCGCEETNSRGLWTCECPA